MDEPSSLREMLHAAEYERDLYRLRLMDARKAIQDLLEGEDYPTPDDLEKLLARLS